MGRSPCCDAADLKRGPWKPKEDRKLVAYIQEHGHGSWSSLPQKAGLKRCGKSCRLRWINYLRPDIKRGGFSLQEAQTIIQLHALLGNRWSAIATHLPKRTDNEIKNYWNTHLKKRLAKMGIDPVTHKPKSAANLIHMAQWESTRLEAEARLVKDLRSRQHQPPSSSGPPPPSPSSELLNKMATTIAPPPCLDILKVWQGCWSGSSQGGGGCGSSAGGCGGLPYGDPKSAANLIHMAQWESTRLEAEARLVKDLRSRQHQPPCPSGPPPPSPSSELLNKMATTIAPPSCLDILKVWQSCWSGSSQGGGGSGAGGSGGGDNTSSNGFSENALAMPDAGILSEFTGILGSIGGEIIETCGMDHRDMVFDAGDAWIMDPWGTNEADFDDGFANFLVSNPDNEEQNLSIGAWCRLE